MKYTLVFESQKDLNSYLRNQSRKCKAFSNDVELNIKECSRLTKTVENHHGDIEKHTLAGFHECGVDGAFYITHKLELPKVYGDYNEIDEITIAKKNDIMYYVVKRLFKNHYNMVERGLKHNMYT